jgi:predicted nucleic acid-binding protein
LKRLVLDASVALAWVVDRNADPYAAEVQRSIGGGVRAVVPVLWQLELSNVLLIVQRRGLMTAEDVDAGLRYFERFLASRAEVVAAFSEMREILRLGRELNLTSYDALYLDLAIREGLPLATLDRRLAQAAEKAGVKLA